MTLTVPLKNRIKCKSPYLLFNLQIVIFKGFLSSLQSHPLWARETNHTIFSFNLSTLEQIYIVPFTEREALKMYTLSIRISRRNYDKRSRRKRNLKTQITQLNLFNLFISRYASQRAQLRRIISQEEKYITHISADALLLNLFRKGVFPHVFGSLTVSLCNVLSFITCQ